MRRKTEIQMLPKEMIAENGMNGGESNMARAIRRLAGYLEKGASLFRSFKLEGDRIEWTLSDDTLMTFDCAHHMAGPDKEVLIMNMVQGSSRYTIFDGTIPSRRDMAKTAEGALALAARWHDMMAYAGNRCITEDEVDRMIEDLCRGMLLTATAGPVPEVECSILLPAGDLGAEFRYVDKGGIREIEDRSYDAACSAILTKVVGRRPRIQNARGNDNAVKVTRPSIRINRIDEIDAVEALELMGHRKLKDLPDWLGSPCGERSGRSAS
jgi:hypothetical protein